MTDILGVDTWLRLPGTLLVEREILTEGLHRMVVQLPIHEGNMQREEVAAITHLRTMTSLQYICLIFPSGEKRSQVVIIKSFIYRHKSS